MKTIRRFFAVALAVAWSSASFAAEPTIRNLDIRGLRIAGTTTLTIDGDDLGQAPRLLLPFTAKATLKPGGNDKKAAFDVTLGADVVPGYHHLRIVTDGGVSLPVVIGVDRLPQQLVTAPVNELPIALHGTVAGGATVEAKFQGKAKQKVMVEVEALRFGSKLRPIVHLLSPKKLQLAWSWAMTPLHGDTRLEATLPEDGAYTVTLHDVEYAAAAPSFFRLRIGEWGYFDQTFPQAIMNKGKYEVNLIGSATPTAVVVESSEKARLVPIAWPSTAVWSGPRPFIAISSHNELMRDVKSDLVQGLAKPPVAVNGKLLTPFEEHRYRVEVESGKKVRLEVFAERLGSPIDTALVVRNEKGDQLVRAEDSPGTLDPVLEYTVPDKTTSIIVGVVDAQGRGGLRGIYRLVIEPQGAIKDFKLTTNVQRLSLPIGGRIVVPVTVERRGHQGKIDLTLKLPPAVKASGTTIAEGADGTLMTLERAESPFEAVVTTWTGRDDAKNESPLAIKGHPMERVQPWLANEIAIAPSNVKAAEFVVDWRDLPPDVALVPGSKLTLPIKTTRANPKTSVKLTLLTSQITPLVNNQPDPNKAIRQEKPIEIPVNMPNGDVVALTPVDLSAPVYDVTVQAELLDAAKKTIAVAYTPVRRMVVKLPLVVKLDGPSRIEAALNAKTGATIKLQGKVERIGGVKSDVLLALTGLPAGAKADPVTVKADASDFVINVTIPPTTPPGEIKGVKLSGSFAPEPKTPAVRVRSRDVDVTLVLTAPAK
ncbi:MAG: hypothetical protein HY289_06795 [Planctomycetes bacterium]|nr:hypothetical protein [Planctomycetota bacterium]